MTYRIKIVRMLDGKRSESWLTERDDFREGGSHYRRGAALYKAECVFADERYAERSDLVAVELVEVT